MEELDINVYPNPATEFLYIESHIKASLEIFNNLGQMVLSSQLDPGTQSINVAKLSPGLYLVVGRKEGFKEWNQKLIIVSR